MAGDRLQLCSAQSVWDCNDDRPVFREVAVQAPWIRSGVVIDRTVSTGDAVGFHPMPMLPFSTLYVRARLTDNWRSGVVQLRIMYGGAYGWSEPEFSETIHLTKEQ